MRAEILQTQTAVDEEAVRRYGEDYERSVRDNAYRALADMMIQKCSATETIIHPDANNVSDYDRFRMRRYYRFTVVVGDVDQAALVKQSTMQGRKEALDAMKILLKEPNDYQGKLRGMMLSWLEGVTPERLAHVYAQQGQPQ